MSLPGTPLLDGPARAQSQILFSQASSSHQLLRSMTSNLGGAITATVPATPAEFRRQPTRRLQDRQAHDEVLNEQVMVRFGLILCFTGLLALIISFAALICGVLAVRAAAQYGDAAPCDAPLKTYTYMCFTLTMVKGQLIQRLSQVCLSRSQPTESQWRVELAVFLVDLPFTVALVGTGIRFLWMAKTCPVTNPMLYYPVRRYVSMYIVSLSVGYAFGSGLLVLLRRVLRSGFIRSAGSCSKAVQSLPAVPFDAAAMRDTDDGTLLECVICQEEFSASKAIIRTGCSHLFHRECLAKWCAAHVTCPLCRLDIGAPD